MTVGDKVQAVISELHQHAKNVANDAEAIKACADTGKQTDFGINTFGIIGQIFSGGARTQAHQVSDNLSKTVQFVQSVSRDLDDTAETYKQTDGGNAEVFKQLQEGLDHTRPGTSTPGGQAR